MSLSARWRRCRRALRGPGRDRRCTFRPRLEALEDRRCPAQVALTPPVPIHPPQPIHPPSPVHPAEPLALLHLGDHPPQPAFPPEPT
jgi:hypothetical protein